MARKIGNKLFMNLRLTSPAGDWSWLDIGLFKVFLKHAKQFRNCNYSVNLDSLWFCLLAYYSTKLNQTSSQYSNIHIPWTRNRCVITIRTNPPMFIMKTKHLEQIQDIKDNLTFLEAREAIWRNWVGRRRGCGGGQGGRESSGGGVGKTSDLK